MTPRTRPRTLLLALFGLSLAGCAGGWPAPKTINDVARAACAAYFSRVQGISIDDAARVFCAVPEVLAPFLRAQQSGEAAAGPEAELAAQKAGIKK
jgi:hypothetical protein